MLPAANRGSGQSIGVPDVCNTPAGPATVPVPYVNLADHTQATGFSTIVSVAGSNALHLGTSIPMTSGDEAGTAHSTIKGKAAFTTGNSVVFIENQPAITLTSPTTHNANNCGSGLVAVPGAATVLFTRRDAAPAGHSELGGVSAQALAALAEAMLGAAAEVETATLAGGAGYVRLPIVAPTTPARLQRAIAAFAAAPGIVLDLRGNAGGDLRAMLRLAEELLPRGAVVARLCPTHGAERALVCRHEGAAEPPIALLVDGGTASAAEIFAAALRFHRRARLFGATTYGKDEVQRVVCNARGGASYATVGRCSAPDGASLAMGSAPDVALDPAQALGAAAAWLVSRGDRSSAPAPSSPVPCGAAARR